MKFVLAVMASALVMVAVYAVAAPASQQSVSGRIAKLERKVKKLQKAVKGIEGRLGCEAQVLPISEYGDGSGGTFGYSYSNDGSTFFLTTALDVTGSGDTVGAWIPVVNSACVGSSSAQLNRLRVLPTQRH